MTGSRRTVCIHAPVGAGQSGGTEQYVLGLAAGLSRLSDGEEEYVFVADDRASTWLARYLSGPARLHTVAPPLRGLWLGRFRPLVARPYEALVLASRRLRRAAGADGVRPEPSPGIERALGAAVVHFPTQQAYLTDLPSIYQPHDLQHVHLPALFDAPTRRAREVLYAAHCRAASLVVASSSWVRDDLASHFGIPPDRLAVIPPGPPNAEYGNPGPRELDEVRRRLGFEEPFALYPAVTWPHKNHAGLLRALAVLKRRGTVVRLVAPGRKTEHFPALEALAADLGVSDQVRFVAYVSPSELQSLYRLARAVVIPTLFEAASFPVMEAQLAGAPVACSRVTSLPRQVGDSALLFDPTDPDSIADAVGALWGDEGLRARLSEKGRRNVLRFDWTRAARAFRAHYRRLAGWPLTDEDRALLSAPPDL